MQEKVRFVMPALADYEYCGKQHIWFGPDEEILVPYNKVTSNMYKKAFRAFAKIIVTHTGNFKDSDWKYINNINFHIVFDKYPIKKKPKKTTKVLYEYTDIFGNVKQVTDKGERIKPIKKGEKRNNEK